MTENHDIDLWRLDAACKGLPTAWWYDDATRNQAVAICNTCPVQHQCHTHATRTREQYGVWGADTSRLRNNHRHPRTRNQHTPGPTATDRTLAALHPTQWSTPHAIAERTGLQPNTIQKILRRLINNGTPIDYANGGYYRHAQNSDADAEVTG